MVSIRSQQRSRSRPWQGLRLYLAHRKVSIRSQRSRSKPDAPTHDPVLESLNPTQQRSRSKHALSTLDGDKQVSIRSRQRNQSKLPPLHPPVKAVGKQVSRVCGDVRDRGAKSRLLLDEVLQKDNHFHGV